MTRGKKTLLVEISFWGGGHPPQRCPLMSPLLFMECLKTFFPQIFFSSSKSLVILKTPFITWWPPDGKKFSFLFPASRAKGHVSREFWELKSQDSWKAQSWRLLCLRVLFLMLPLICCPNHFSPKDYCISLYSLNRCRIFQDSEL